MCNLSQGIWQDGIKEGLEQGLERGEINAKRETGHHLAGVGRVEAMAVTALKVNVPLIEEWLAEE